MDDTPSIAVLAATAEHLRAFLAGPEAFDEAFGLTVEEGLDLFPGALAKSLAGLDDGSADPDWHTHLFVDVDGRRVVGFGGYKGPPRSGEVEIGYALAPATRGRGIAAAAVRELADRARGRGATLCVAHTLPEPSASTAVLRRCGFSMVGEGLEPGSGPVWRWELALA